MPRDGKRVRGSTEERARVREELRGELLAAARTLIEETGGTRSVTMRAVADRVGYTAPIVYQYFANKRDLLLGVVDDGFGELADRLAEADALPAAAEAYWTFAMRRPHVYRLMHGLVDVPFGTAAAPAAARRCFELLRTAVEAAAPEHPATGEDDDAATDLYWAHLHGLVMLTLDGRIKGGRRRAYRLVRHIVAGHAPDSSRHPSTTTE
ncbi:TetR family transcriptional regulator [Herbihabitans rhizosphaerae]|uniref:TetR family transcriptional regulator n=1 Tax=Herbihabitans rhizosphaerae TaxID=1872711 RepID=A0A4Q7KLJ4_9PSEU|nr:TetR/AcrR family transcriptional regulator [Herbihabitans rhizosphaerae]RZS37509.1 TetR family transcriptional regulator [Herbihabitans rhizosphaerae]